MKNRLIPKLRFPEFRDKKLWESTSFSEVMFEHGHKSLGSEQVHSVSVHKGLVNQIEHLGRSFSAKSTLHYNRVLPGDLVYTKSPTGEFPLGIIKQSKLNFPVIVSPLYGVFSPETYSLGTILEVFFESPSNTRMFLEPLVQKGAKNTINIKNSRFLTGTLILPLDKNEQQKIADCLSSIDELISLHTKKLKALKDHKKGLLQNLFPQEGEKVPKLRFPEFRDAGEWTSSTLNNLTKINQGLQIPISERYTEKIENSFFYITNEFLKLNTKRSYYIKNPPKNVRCKDEDVLMTRTGNTGQVVTGVSGAFHNNFFKIQFDRKILNKDFFVYFLRLHDTQRIIMSYAGASTIPDLNHSDFYRIIIKTPSSKEQQKIASCLSSIDDQISAQTKKVEILKKHKKGLTQQLFPSAKELYG